MKIGYLLALVCLGWNLTLAVQPALASSMLSPSGSGVLVDSAPEVVGNPVADEHKVLDASSIPLPGISPAVIAMDDQVQGSPVEGVSDFMAQLDADWAREWGWRPQHPVTVYAYFDGKRMADGVCKVVGYDLTPARRAEIAATVAGLKVADNSTDGWAILVNLSKWYGTDRWQPRTRHLLTHEYTHVMQAEAAGGAGPTWFHEGMADLNAFMEVPEALPFLDRTKYVVRAEARGELPGLSYLDDGWQEMIQAGGDRAQLAYGESYLAVKYLADRTGPASLLEVLKGVSGGASFEDSLQEVTGYTLDQLDAEYRATIPAAVPQ